MSDKELRNKIIRLAHTKPELRKDLLPLLKEVKVAGSFRFKFIIYDKSGRPVDKGTETIRAKSAWDAEETLRMGIEEGLGEGEEVEIFPQ